MGESQMGREIGQYTTDFNNFGVVGKPSISAFQRNQNHQNPLRFDLLHEPFLIRP